MKQRRREHPLFAAERLQLANRMRRWAAAPLRMTALAALIGGGLGGLIILVRPAARADAWMMSLDAYGPMVIGLTALYAAMLTGRRRRSADARQSRLWLGAAPISSAALAAHRTAGALGPLFFQVLAASAFVLLAAGGPTDIALRIVARLWGGALLGALAAWFTPIGRPQQRREDSRYAPRARRLPPAASLASLSHWPIAQTFAWGRPENLRALVVVCLLLGVQAGSSALHGLLILSVWLAGGYLGSLLFAVPRAAIAAAEWLRTTPLAFGRFAWALARRALLHQALGVVLLGSGLIAMGAAPPLTLYFAVLWLSIVVLVYAISAADAYQGRSPTMKLALSFAGVAAIESRFHAWSIPAALLVVALRLRSMHR